MLARVRTPSSLVKEREKEGGRERKRERERETERERVLIFKRNDGYLGTF